MENCYIKNLKKRIVKKNIEYNQSYIHLKPEKQLKMFDPQIFCAFMHKNEPPNMSNGKPFSDKVLSGTFILVGI